MEVGSSPQALEIRILFNDAREPLTPPKPITPLAWEPIKSVGHPPRDNYLKVWVLQELHASFTTEAKKFGSFDGVPSYDGVYHISPCYDPFAVMDYLRNWCYVQLEKISESR